jgi:hypothetical protein
MSSPVVTHETVSSWIIPVLLTTCIGVLSWMAITLQDIGRNLAVVVYRVDDHERRMQALEGIINRTNR